MDGNNYIFLPFAIPIVYVPKIGKNMIFWRKIVIFHTKYPNNFRASFRSAQFFQVRPPNFKSWIRPCMLYDFENIDRDLTKRKVSRRLHCHFKEF
jgi:hypothetical protein